MSDFDLVVTGRVVTTDRVIDDGYVAVRGGTIDHVGSGAPPAAAETQRFGDAFVLPGAIDAQVHSRSQKGQEDFVWSTRSAAAGGVTTIVDMPYDDGDLIATPERLTAKARSGAEQARVDFALYATLHPRDGAERVDGLVAAGAAAFKFSLFETHPERFPRVPPHKLVEFFTAIARHGLIAGVHNEIDEMVRAFIATEKARDEGTDFRSHGRSRPPVTEALASGEVFEIGAATGCSAHVVHSSIARGYEMAAGYRALGHDATIEACIHYLVLGEEDLARLHGLGKVNPPIRPIAEREAIWRHLAAGNVTVVSTDHVSWSLDRKTDRDMFSNASGVPGLEVLYPLLVQGLLDRGLPLTWAPRLLAENPARLFRIGHAKGALAPGRDADITVLAHRPGRYDPAASGHNVVSWSPYEGLKLDYRPVATFLRGRTVFDGSAVAEPGMGRFVRPARPVGSE
ncbi:MAG: amidohydrolase family protein [Bauldia sp.]|nr:amidohydrolase family protein [Bauldia sp.]